MNIELARATDVNEIEALYGAVVDDLLANVNYPGWKKGIYPEEDYLIYATNNDQMYLAILEDRIIGACMFNTKCSDGYENVNWKVELKDGEYAVIHLLGVIPDSQKQGIGKFMVNNLISIAKEKGYKSVRLDVLEGNIPASKLYTSCGFDYIETVELFYEDTGRCNFLLYEYII